MTKTKFVVCFTLLMLVLAAALVCARNIKLPRPKEKPGPNKTAISGENVTIWQDRECTIPLTEIIWGPIHPGETKNFTGWIRSESEEPIRLNIVVTLSGRDWTIGELVARYFTFGCACENELQPREVVEARFYISLRKSCPQEIDGVSMEMIIIGRPLDYMPNPMP